MARIRVTEDVFLKIREKLDKYPTLSHELIAQLCGCSDSTVDNVAYCETWADWLELKRKYRENRYPKEQPVEQLPGQTQMQDIPMQATPEKRIKVYFTNGNTAVFPQSRTKFWNTLPAVVEPGMIAVNWNTVAWMREYQEDA